MQRNNNILIIILVAISVFTIALTIYVRDLSRKQTSYYVTDSILDYLDPNQILGDNNSIFTVADQEPNQFSIKWKISELYQGQTVRLNTLGSPCPRIMGTCWNGKGSLRHEYPVWIDTGYTGNVLLTDSIVKDAKLGFYPKRLDDDTAGLCHLCQLKIDDITFVHPYTICRTGHYKRKTFGEDVLIEHELLLGLGTLKNFKYILIDTLANQIEFSVQDSFDPNDPGLWRNFPMTIETLKNNNYVLFLTVPINGKDRTVRFDTCAETGIHVANSYWEEFSKSLDYKGPKTIRLKKVDGIKKAAYYTVKELEFAGDVFSNARIITGLSKDTYFGNWDIMVGMEFFKGCVLVLDFENELLWQKQAIR